MKHCGPTDVWRHGIKFIRPGVLESGVCVSLMYTHLLYRLTCL